MTVLAFNTRRLTSLATLAAACSVGLSAGAQVAVTNPQAAAQPTAPAVASPAPQPAMRPGSAATSAKLGMVKPSPVRPAGPAASPPASPPRPGAPAQPPSPDSGDAMAATPKSVTPRPPAPRPADRELLGSPPAGAPEVNLLFIQWSKIAKKRVASLRNKDGRLVVVHEGDLVEGMRVAAIRPDAIEFVWRGSQFLVLASRY